MKTKDHTATFTVNASPEEVFKSINSVSQWWTEDIKGSSQKIDDEFTVRFFGDVHVSTQKLVEVVPNQKVVWLVTDSKLNFIEKKNEWTGTKISFEISRKDNKTQLHFTHIGLIPQVECYNDCVQGWKRYLDGSLIKLIVEGKGLPEPK
jgi:hypothetical protein